MDFGLLYKADNRPHQRVGREGQGQREYVFVCEIALFYSLQHLSTLWAMSHNQNLGFSFMAYTKKSKGIQVFSEASRGTFKYTTHLHLLLHHDTNFKYT